MSSGAGVSGQIVKRAKSLRQRHEARAALAG
jgi:hypothetical protein